MAGRSVAGEGVVEGLQVRADLAVLVAEQVAQPLLHRAAGAPAGMDAAGLPAVRAAAPEAGVRAGAGRAERLAGGAAADRPGLAAARAPDPALLAGPAPWLAGGFGDQAGGVLPADPAGQDLPWHAVRAQRPAGCPDVDRPAPAAAGAGFLVSRIGDQALGAQRLAVLVTGRDLRGSLRTGRTAGSGTWPRSYCTTTARRSAGCRWTTRPQPGHGGADDTGGASVAQHADQPQHRRRGCPGAGAGQQPGLIFQGPGQPAALPGPGGHGVHRADHGPCGHRRIDRGDDPGDDGGGVWSRHLAGTGGIAAARPGRGRSPAGCCRRTRSARAAGRRHGSTSPARGAAGRPGPCRTRRRPAPRSRWPLPCAARSAGPRRPGAPGNGRRSGPPAARRARRRACAAWPGRPRR